MSTIAYVALGLLVVWTGLIVASTYARQLSNEIWDRYLVVLVKYGWIYFAILVVYRVAESGPVRLTMQVH